MDLEHLPGGDLVAKGLQDLALSRETDEALLVSIGAPRLRRQGLPVEKPFPEPGAPPLRAARPDRLRLGPRALQRSRRPAHELRERPRMRRLADAGRLRRFLKELARDADAETDPRSFRRRLEDSLEAHARDQETGR